MNFRLWVFSVAACVLPAGCAAPRTFVSNAPALGETSSAEEPQLFETDEPVPEAESNPEKPSVWSQWTGVFTKSPASKTPVKPIEHIPLPRTDLETAGEASNSTTGDDADF